MTAAVANLKKKGKKRHSHRHPLDKGRGGMRLENSKWHSSAITAAFEHIFSCLDHSVVTSLAATARSLFMRRTTIPSYYCNTDRRVGDVLHGFSG